MSVYTRVFSRTIACLGTTMVLAACSNGAPTADVPAPVATVTVAAPTPVLTTVTITPEPAILTVTAPPVTITVSPEQPIDVTSQYLAWRKRHFDPEYPESASQYQNVVRAVLANGELNVLTLMRQPMGGWNCEGEPATISGRTVAFVRILYQDSTVFRLCAVR
jgi:hypothetical protein